MLGAILALFVTGYAAMSQHVTNAGAFYATSRRESARSRRRTLVVALIAYNSMQIGILGLFGAVFAGFMFDKADIDFAWYTWVFVAIGLIGILGWLRVDLNAKVLAILLTTEILVVILFDLVVIGDPGPGGLSGDAFDPSIAFGAGLGSALCFTMAAFVGFESAAIYGEECKDPRRTVARATYIALGITALFYAFSAWMLQSAVGAQVVTDPNALVEGGFVGATGGPDPTTILFITLDVQTSTIIADIATLLFCDQPVRRFALLPQRRLALLLRARQGAGHPERVRQGARERRAVHRLDGSDDHRGNRGGHLRPVRQRPGAPALHLAHQPGRDGRDPVARPGLVRDRRILQQVPAHGVHVDLADRSGPRRAGPPPRCSSSSWRTSTC